MQTNARRAGCSFNFSPARWWPERFPPRLVVFVKFQPLLHRFEIFHLRGGGQFERVLRGKSARWSNFPSLGAGHAQRVEHDRLAAAGQQIGLGGERERVLAVARGGIFVRGQHVRGEGENLQYCPGQSAARRAVRPRASASRPCRRKIFAVSTCGHGYCGSSRAASANSFSASSDWPSAASAQPRLWCRNCAVGLERGRLRGIRPALPPGRPSWSSSVGEIVVASGSGRVRVSRRRGIVQRLGEPALLFQRDAEIDAARCRCPGHGERVAEKRFAVAPEAQLVFRGENAGGQNQNGQSPREHGFGNLKSRRANRNAGKSDGDKNADGRQVTVTVGQRRAADLHEADDRHEHAEKPQPAGEQIRPRFRASQRGGGNENQNGDGSGDGQRGNFFRQRIKDRAEFGRPENFQQIFDDRRPARFPAGNAAETLPARRPRCAALRCAKK